MKTDVSSTIVHSEGFQSESFFSIKQDNLAHIFGILRNQLYSNKPLAVIREYCTNAFDAHVDAGKADEPIIVTVPTHISPTLIIRDNGNGLTTEQVYQVFASYGESTKRGTNDQVGMLGLGSKSAFCYVDSFTVTSYNNGVKSVYNAFIDTTQIGKISLTHTEPTDESGLEIKIHVASFDIPSFNQSIVDFLKFFNPKPIILNNDAIKRQVSDFDFHPLLSGDNWKVTRRGDWNNSRVYITMGNVNYPVSVSSLPDYQLREFIDGLNNYYLYVNVPIGTVKPSASRESLDMNSKTINQILASLEKVKNEIQSEFTKKIESSKSMWEAYQTFNNLHNTLGFRGLKATYQGTPISSNCILPKKGQLKKYNKRFGNSRSHWVKEISIIPKTNAIIFHHDKTIAMNSVYSRILQYLDTTNDELRNELYLLSFHDTSLMNEWLNDARFDGAFKVDLATIPYVNPKKASVHKVVKSTAYLYTGAGYRNYSKWRDITIDLNGTGVYLPIKRNMCEYISFESLDRLIDNMSRIDNSIDIIGVRADEVKTLGRGWVNYFDYCQQKGLEYIEKHDLQDSINKHFAYNGIPSNWELIKRKQINFGGTDLDLFFSNLKSTPYSVTNLLYIQREINKTIVNLTDSKYLDEYNVIKDKYDLIPALDTSPFSILTDEMLIKYVNMVN
jgi:hypothetical protein